MQNHNINKIKDIEEWNNDGDWVSWKALQDPLHLQNDYSLFSSQLHGIAPLSIRSHDSKGWGKMGFYMVKEGYQMLKRNRDRNHKCLWDKVWNSDNIPKINIFFCLSVKNKLLKADNLRERGFSRAF